MQWRAFERFVQLHEDTRQCNQMICPLYGVSVGCWRYMMRNVGLVITVLGLVAVFSGCLKTTNYKPLPAPAGESWGIERDRLSQSTMSGSSYQQRSAYDNKVYNVYVTKMSLKYPD